MHSDSNAHEHDPHREESDFDRRLDIVLASLPREKASDDFTEAVIERIDQRRSSRRQWQTLAAAALILLTLGLGSLQWNRHQDQLEAVERMARLNAEYQVLQAELEALEATREKARPTIYLGSANDDVDLVLDLWRLASATGATDGADLSLPSGNARPENASNRAAARPKASGFL